MTKVTVNSQRPSVQTQNIGISAASQAQVNAGTATGVYVEPATLANWTGALPSQTGNTGKYLTTNGTTASWATVSSGGTSFIGLTDVPASFSGASLKLVRVNSGETALEFFTAPYINSSGSTSITNVSMNAVGITNSILIGLDDETIQSNSIDFTALAGMSIRSYDGAGYTGDLTSMLFSGSVLQVSSAAPNWTGITYAADYSAGYTLRSLIDKGYADGAYLSKTLTADNTITGDGHNLTFTGQKGFNITQGALSSGWVSGLVVTPGDHTAFTATTEFVANDFVGGSQTWLDGTVTNQRFTRFRAFTLNKTTTSATFTNAYTVYIDKPIAGTGVTINAAYGLGVAGNINIGTGTATRPAISFGAEGASNGGASGIYYTTNIINISAATSRVAYFGYYGAGILQQSLASSFASAFTVTPGAHTSLTAATEFISNDFQGATQTWADGTVVTQRFNYFRGFTLNKTTTSATFTSAYTVYIDAPTAGTSVTITNNWALGVNGNVKIAGTRVNMASLPTSSAGLATGDIWNNSGVINIV